MKTFKVGLIIKRLNDEVLSFLERVSVSAELLQEKAKGRVEFQFEQSLIRSLGRTSLVRGVRGKGRKFEDLVQTSDLLVSIGGDGTILRCARSLLETNAWRKTSILGINAGRLGFLASIPLHEASQTLERILLHPSRIKQDRRTCLELKILRRGKVAGTYYALNDCVLKTSELSRLLEFQVDIDNEFLSSYRADGLIVASPTGSTAYSLAAGGSILEPSVSALLLTPICAQSFTNRPILIGDQRTIRIRVIDPDLRTLVTLDGQRALVITPEDEILIQKADRTIAFALPRDSEPHHYFHSLRQKLKWGLESTGSA